MICPHCVFHAVTSFIDVFPILNQQGTALYNGIFQVSGCMKLDSLKILEANEKEIMLNNL